MDQTGLERFCRVSMLYDFYGSLLTEKQRRCLELHYFHDWSLAEIAAELAISRQAVHDALQRSEWQMEEYEKKLGMYARHKELLKILDQVKSLLNAMPPYVKKRSEFIEATTLLDSLRGVKRCGDDF